jgi:hypothetical protein
MVALTLLLAGGLGVVTLLSAAVRQEAAMAEREATLRDADRALAALSLFTRADLDRRLGRHPAGRFLADVRRPEPALYRIALLESDTSQVELLVTVVHRPAQVVP